jgi:hypothetical protein
VTANAPQEVKDRAKRFVSYRLPGAGDEAPLNYALWTEKTEIVQGEAGGRTS